MLTISLQINHDISQIIVSNQQQFKPLLERIIDRGDPMVVLVSNSLKVMSLEMQNNNEGIAQVSFQAKSIASCHGTDSIDEHKTKLAFTIKNNTLFFAISLPPAWTFDY